MQEDKLVIQHDPPQLFDRIFKALMQLSDGALVNFINGLFGTTYPLNSAVECLETEQVTETLHRWISDKRLIINHTDKYLIEVQMTDDEEMALRIFNYDYLEAVKTKTIGKNRVTLDFSRALVIYLEPTAQTPTELIVTLKFPDKSVHDFRVPALRFLDYSIAELEERNLNILLPFYLLKLRKRVKAAGSSKKRLALSGEMKQMVEELAETIEGSEEKGLMSKADIRKVMVLMGKLYNGLYKGYKEFEEVNGMVADMLLAELTEAELVGEQRGERRGEQRGEQRAKVHVARKLIQKGWDSAEIAETTELDRELVESLMGAAQA